MADERMCSLFQTVVRRYPFVGTRRAEVTYFGKPQAACRCYKVAPILPIVAPLRAAGHRVSGTHYHNIEPPLSSSSSSPCSSSSRSHPRSPLPPHSTRYRRPIVFSVFIALLLHFFPLHLLLRLLTAAPRLFLFIRT